MSGRVARRYPALLVALLALALGLAGCSSEAVQSAYLQANRSQLDQPASATAQPEQFVVQPGTPARTVAENLQNHGLIKDARLFEAYVRVNGLSNRLEAGTFTLSPHMTIPQIAAALQHGRADSNTITIPEGWRLEQVAGYLNLSGVLDGDAYRALAAGGDAAALDGGNYDFLRFRPAGASFEGYLFPDTYDLPARGATPADLIRRQLQNFAGQVVPAYDKAVAETGAPVSLHDVITLASIVEREAVVDDERPVIARVYLNRLAANMKLDADPTVQYAMGYQPATGQWWKTPVSLDEYATVNSPYNTYLHPGLPPGPICNPGLASILAVLHPANNDYLYFVALPDGSGRHAFARTFAEHQQNVRRYLGQP